MAGIFGIVNLPGAANSLDSMGSAMTGTPPGVRTGDVAIDRAGFGVRSNSAYRARKALFISDEWVAAFDGTLFGEQASALDRSTYAEAALRQFLRRGEDFALELRGNFCIAFYNRREHKLWLYADHFSSKPVYHCLHGGVLYFASELKALLAVDRIPAKLHVDALREAFAMGYVCGSKTLVQGIERIPPGTYLRFDGERGTATREVYFPLDGAPSQDIEGSKEDRLEGVLRDALRTGLASADDSQHKPLFTLSGGLDSRAVCALARDLGVSPLVTWNLAEPDSIEQRLAARAAEALQAQHHSLVYDEGYWIIDLIDAAVEAGDGMHHFIDSARMLYALPAFQERGFGVLHTGMSGDFLFGSFLTAEDLDENRPPAARADLLDAITHRLCMGLWRGLERLQDEAGDRAAFVSAVRASLEATLDDFEVDGRSRALEMWNLRNRQVRGIFGYYRGAEAYMEYSSPFYDPEVFRFAFQLPLAERYHERLYLQVLKVQILPHELAEIPWAKTGMPIVDEASLQTSLRRALLLLRKRVLHPLSVEAWRRSSANPYLYWFWKNQDLRDHVRDQLVEFDHPEIFYLKRKDLIRFLDDWRRRPTRYRDSLLHLLYLLAAVRWLELHRDQVDV